MKKIAIGILSTAFFFGAGTFALAQPSEMEPSVSTFEKMLPFMQKMHPESSESELKEMYDACHAGGRETVQTNNIYEL